MTFFDNFNIWNTLFSEIIGKNRSSFVSLSGKFYNPYYHNLDDQLTNIQNDLNGNKQKIEDANGVIKRHTEQLIELEPEINDLKHEMSELDRHVKGKYLLETI